MRIGLSVEDGLEEILNIIGEMPEEEIPCADAAGRVLSRTLTSPENIPPFRRAPLDGYAFISEDTVNASGDHPVELTIIEEIPAGKAPEHDLKPGQCVKILTGAPLPEGADVVEKFESVEVIGDVLKLTRTYRHNENVVPIGEDVCVGDLLLEKGTVISPAYLGILAGLGFDRVPVYKKPLVCLISTGSELVPIDEKPLPLGKIRNSSIYTIMAFLNQQGINTMLMPLVKDDLDQISNAVVTAAAKADVVMTTGGVSVGDYDLLLSAMDQIGADKIFWKLKMKPGMAFLASVYKGKPIISLSGNPSSAVISMIMTVLPALRKLSGRSDYMFETCQVKVLSGLKKKNHARRFIPGRLVIRDGMACMESCEQQSNGILHPLHGCNLLIEVAPGTPPLAAGDIVKAYLL